MKRCFDSRQRRILAWVAGGRCQRCNVRLTTGFHADHVVPYSKGGPTTTTNGQALCPGCNLRKADR